MRSIHPDLHSEDLGLQDNLLGKATKRNNS